MKEHFSQAINETEHLKEMEHRGGDKFWKDRFFCKTFSSVLLLENGL